MRTCWILKKKMCGDIPDNWWLSRRMQMKRLRWSFEPSCRQANHFWAFLENSLKYSSCQKIFVTTNRNTFFKSASTPKTSFHLWKKWHPIPLDRRRWTNPSTPRWRTTSRLPTSGSRRRSRKRSARTHPPFLHKSYCQIITAIMWLSYHSGVGQNWVYAKQTVIVHIPM